METSNSLLHKSYQIQLLNVVNERLSTLVKKNSLWLKNIQQIAWKHQITCSDRKPLISHQPKNTCW